jgi:AraC-like DNA-binding protein
MPEESLTIPMRFNYQGGMRWERHYPVHVGWRDLPHALLCIPEGGNWELELRGAPPVTVHSGEAMVILQGVSHRFHMSGAKVMWSNWALVSFEGLADKDLLAAAGVPAVLPRPTADRLYAVMAEIRELDPAIAQGDLPALARRQMLGFRMLEILLERAATRRLEPAHPELDRLLPALHYVDSHLGEPIPLAELARQVSLSTSRFHHVFRSVLGMTPRAYVQKARLRLAQHLLITSARPVADVAEQAGFASPYHFSHAFRRHMHTTPSAFRKEFWPF